MTCRSRIAKFILIGNPIGPLPTRNFIGSFEVKCRSKVAKTILIKNPRWPLSWKFYIELLLLNRKANWLETCLVFRCAIQGHLDPFVLTRIGSHLVTKNFAGIFIHKIRLSLNNSTVRHGYVDLCFKDNCKLGQFYCPFKETKIEFGKPFAVSCKDTYDSDLCIINACKIYDMWLECVLWSTR